eukprot:UN03592
MTQNTHAFRLKNAVSLRGVQPSESETLRSAFLSTRNFKHLLFFSLATSITQNIPYMMNQDEIN